MSDINQSIRSVAQLVRWGEQYLLQSEIYLGHGTDNAWDESVAIVLYGIGVDYQNSREYARMQLDTDSVDKIQEMFYTRVKRRIPVPYLTRQAWFCGEPYYVDERVIIPRSPIAELIANRFSPWLDDGISVIRILDLCCGSGCIGIACAKAFPNASVDLVDVSHDALQVAAINITKHGVGSRVNCLRSDLFESLTHTSYDLIVSNPPYVDAEDLDSMPLEFTHEPGIALAGGADGLDLVSRVLQSAKNYLNETGLLVVEVGNSESAVVQRYPDLPFTWATFERGGHGVFILESGQLR